jgi:hypothetical protein
MRSREISRSLRSCSSLFKASCRRLESTRLREASNRLSNELLAAQCSLRALLTLLCSVHCISVTMKTESLTNPMRMSRRTPWIQTRTIPFIAPPKSRRYHMMDVLNLARKELGRGLFILAQFRSTRTSTLLNLMQSLHWYVNHLVLMQDEFSRILSPAPS